MNASKKYLKSLLEKSATEESRDWLEEKIKKFQSKQSDIIFYMTFGGIPRQFGREHLKLDDPSLEEAEAIRKGLDPTFWTISETARIYLLLHLPLGDQDVFVQQVEKLFSTADMGEQVALFSSLPLLPFPEAFIKRTTEGIRTNIQDVFDAIALNNPYPADYLPELAWNQMVLKAAFMNRPLYRIVGMESRANPTLAKIISDYAHERWSAGRIVSPELWRTFGKHLLAEMLPDIERLLKDENTIQQQAGVLVCKNSPLPEAKELLEKYSEINNFENLSWDQLSSNWWTDNED